MKAQDLVTLAARDSFHMLRENRFEFRISYPAKLPSMRADKHEFKVCLLCTFSENLIQNILQTN